MQEDLIAFTQMLMPHLFPLMPPWPHWEISDLLFMGKVGPEKEGTEEAYGRESPCPRRVAIAMSRGLGKSRLISVGYTLHQALMMGAEDIVLVSATAALVEGWLRLIRGELERNELILDMVGDLRGDPWRDDMLRLKNGVVIRALGRGAQIRGMRPDLVVVDDLEDEEEARSETQRDYLEDWFHGALVPALRPNGRLVMIGTPVHPECLLWQVVGANEGKGMSGWVTRCYPASSEKEAKGEATWPGLWPMKALRTIRSEIGAIRYAREYDCDPVPDASRIFLRKWLTWHEQMVPGETTGMWKIMTLDPALGTEDRHDSSAYVVLGVFGSGVDVGKARVLDVVSGKWGFDELLKIGFGLYRKWDVRYWCYEGVAFQKVIRPAVVRMGREMGARPCRMIEMRAIGDKIARAQGVQYLVEQGLVGWPKGKYDEALREVTSFPETAHDDVTDAFVYALRAWELHGSRTWKAGSVNRGPDPKLGNVGGWQEHEQDRWKVRRERRDREKKQKAVVRDVTGLY